MSNLCTIGSYWPIGRTSAPQYDKEAHKWVCPWCGRLLKANTNLGMHAWTLPRHNKPKEPSP